MWKNWKTTLIGFVGAALLIVPKVIAHQPITLSDVVNAGSILGLGSVAKDHNVTGGTTVQASEPKAK